MVLHQAGPKRCPAAAFVPFVLTATGLDLQGGQQQPSCCILMTDGK